MEQVTAAERERAGRSASLVGIAVNLLLAGGKIAVGALFGVVSVLADGLNNLTDCGSSLISLLSFRLSAKPADREHPYGHERIEYIASTVVALLILLVAFETASAAFEKILAPAELTFSFFTIGVLAASILVKGGLYFYYKKRAKRIGSDLLLAAATDSLGDCVSTAVVLTTFFIGIASGVNIDGYAGLLVALFIAYAGIGVLRRTFSQLIGEAPDAALVSSVRQRILAHPEVLGLHDLAVYSYGPHKYFASVHIEVDAAVDVLVSHELVDAIEREFAENTDILLTGHLDPIVVSDSRVTALCERTKEILSSLAPTYTLHDFRVVFGEKQINVLFDVAVPYGERVDKEALIAALTARLRELDGRLAPIITVEHSL